MKESFWNGKENGDKNYSSESSGHASGWGGIDLDGMGKGIADGRGYSDKSGVI